MRRRFQHETSPQEANLLVCSWTALSLSFPEVPRFGLVQKSTARGRGIFNMYFVHDTIQSRILFFFFGSEPKTIDRGRRRGGGGGRSRKKKRSFWWKRGLHTPSDTTGGCVV